jgi:hypothetical protein
VRGVAAGAEPEVRIHLLQRGVSCEPDFLPGASACSPPLGFRRHAPKPSLSDRPAVIASRKSRTGSVQNRLLQLAPGTADDGLHL